MADRARCDGGEDIACADECVDGAIFDEGVGKLRESTAAHRPRLFGPEGDHAKLGVAKSAGGLDRHDNTECAVEAPTVRHCVEMRATPDAGGAASPSRLMIRLTMPTSAREAKRATQSTDAALDR